MPVTPEIESLLNDARRALARLEEAISDKLEDAATAEDSRSALEEERLRRARAEDQLTERDDEITKLKKEVSKLEDKASERRRSRSPTPPRKRSASRSRSRSRSHRSSGRGQQRGRSRSRSQDGRRRGHSRSRARSGRSRRRSPSDSRARTHGKGSGKDRLKLCIPYVLGTCAQGKSCPDRHPDEENCEDAKKSLGQKVCRWGDECKRKDCIFVHPGGGGDRSRRESPRGGRDASRDGRYNGSKTVSGRRGGSPPPGASDKMCRYGGLCKRSDCYFRHP